MRKIYWLLILLVVTGCSTAPIEMPTATATPEPTETLAPTATPEPTATPTATFTPSPTPGPGLEDLLVTPQALYKAGELEAAQAAYEEIADLYPDRAEPLLGQAAVADRQEDADGALELLREAVEAQPDNIDGWRRLSIVLEQRAAYADLLDVYGDMLEIWPDDPALYTARAITAARLGSGAEAISDLEMAQALDIYRAYAWENAAAAASVKRHYDVVIDIADAGLNHHPQSGGLLLERGLAHLSQGDAEAALLDFEAALAIDELDMQAHLWRGRALDELGHSADALAAAQRAAELGVQAGVTNLLTGLEAAADAADILARDDWEAAFDYVGGYYFEYGYRDPIWLAYARIDWQRGSSDLALGRLDVLVRDSYLPGLYWRGVIHADKGETALAVEDLEAYIAAQPAGPTSEVARRLLDDLGASVE